MMYSRVMIVKIFLWTDAKYGFRYARVITSLRQVQRETETMFKLSCWPQSYFNV